MFCSKCGKEIAEGTAFCVYCGARMETSQGQAPGQAGAAAQAGEKKKGKGGKIALAVMAVVVAAAGAGGALYFTSDGYKVKKSMEQAEECFQAEEYKEALAHYEEALELDPGLLEAYRKSADIFLMDEEYGEAVKLLEKGMKKTRDDEDSQESLAEKIEEVKQSEDAAATDKLQRYLDGEIVPQYGYADLSAKKQMMEWDASFEEYGSWTAVKGIADAGIRDLDGDGRDELLTIALDEENVILTVYEVEDNVPVKEAEILEGRWSDMFAYEVLCALVDGQGTDYLFLEQSSWGILSDGYFAEAKLYCYDGANLYVPLELLQTAGGSSEFVYTAYQYDGSGNLLSEEVIYDEVYDHETNYDSTHCYERVAALFGEYGLNLDSGAAISGEKEIFDDLSASGGYEELLRLDMWGDYRDNGAMYHFNDWDSPLLVYQNFLQGKGNLTVHVGEGKWFGSQEEMNLTFQDMLAKVVDTYLGYSDRDTVNSIEYAYLDCGNDGVEELALRFVGLDIYSDDDNSDATVVISCKDGALELVYSCESWARSNTEINYYGCIDSGGSGGAGAYYIEMGYINADGVVQTVYTGEILGGWWVSYVSEELYQEAFGDSEDPDMQISVFNFDDSSYYVAELGDYATQECLDYIALCQAQGMTFVQDQEIDDIFMQRIAELGIQEEWLEEHELYWRICP